MKKARIYKKYQDVRFKPDVDNCPYCDSKSDCLLGGS